MDHVAIMRKSWGLMEKILTGEKKIESRWYKFKHGPWNTIAKWDTVYFKNSGEPVTIKTGVRNVMQFSGLTSAKVLTILRKYGKADGIEPRKLPEFYKRFRDKKYCILIFLSNPKRIKPFTIDKTGFGAMAAWITTANVNNIKK